MKRGIIFIIACIGMVIACCAISTTKKTTPSNSKGFVVIELFSSEGCSSCPPAEAVMHKLIQKANAQSLPVYIIEFHVDYWDYLGWKDTFALPGYTQRQQNYGDFFKLNSIYTPQAIVNGKTEMVGSDEDKLNATIASELQNPASVSITGNVRKTDNSKIEVTYNITGSTSGCELNFALVGSNLTTNVQRGENTHKTLTHDNVARVFKSVKVISPTGKISLETPHVNLTNAKLICYLQNTASNSITGATQMDIVK